MFRELTGLFSLGRESRFGLVSRTSFIAMVFLYSIALIKSKYSGISYTTVMLLPEVCAVFLALYIDKRLSSYLRGMKIVMLFVVLGGLFHLFSYLTGVGPKSWSQAVVGVERTVALLLPLTLTVAWITPGEISYISIKARARTLGLMLGIALSQLPLLLLETADSITAVRLKYGKSKMYKAIYSMLVQSMLLSRAFYEAQYVFGLPKWAAAAFKDIKADLCLIFLGTSMLLFILLL